MMRRAFQIAGLIVALGLPVAGAPPIAELAENERWSELKSAIDETDDLSKPQADGMTALHWAIWYEEVSASLLLIESGANVNAKNRYGVSPLALACTSGNAVIVRSLLKAGADAKEEIVGGETVLMRAARTGKLAAVDALIDAGADANAKERKGQTAIMWAAAEGHHQIVRRLIEADAEFTKQLSSGFNAFFFAVREGKTKTVDTLLAAGASVEDTMQPARQGGRNARKGTSALILAIDNGHFELAAHLLRAGADPNDERTGFTPLHTITWTRKPNLGDGIDGDPPPRGSGSITSLELVRKLVAAGADVNRGLSRGSSGRGRLNHKGATPFFFAADTADVPLMKLLLELGADPKIGNADDCLPLHAAAGLGTKAPGEEAGNEEEALAAVKLLLKLGADINSVDKNGETTMHGAAYASFPLMVDYLTKSGADINVWNRKNRYGWTPVLIAEGHRPGNFKPAHATLAAVHKAMREAGVMPPKPTPRKTRPREDWDDDDKPANQPKASGAAKLSDDR